MAQMSPLLSELPLPTAQKPRRFYQPELDGLRFYAFLGVFAFHTLPSQPAFYRQLHFPAPALWGAAASSGAAGVDLFFALSAFLITSLLMRERQQTGGISLRLFYIRRILRIWPLYFAVVGLGIVLSHTMTARAFPGTTLPAMRCSPATGSTPLSGIHSRYALRCGRSRSKNSSI